MTLFNAGDSIGSLPASEILTYLTDIQDLKDAALFAEGTVDGQSLFTKKTPYTQKGVILGYISPGGAGNTSPVMGISQAVADKSLIGQRIKISLDKFYVHSYPGMGTHSILCEFAGKNQLAGDTEQLRFAMKFTVADQGSASVSGVPLFLGVTVGNDGISFEGRTVNVASTTDETLLATLESSAFKSGLSLLHTAQPALKPLSSLAEAVVKSTLMRSKNKQVHNFDLGLDFGRGATSARLRHGSYVVIQSDAQLWNWSDLEWHRDSLSLRFKDGIRNPDFNYMVFGISQFIGTGKAVTP